MQEAPRSVLRRQVDLLAAKGLTCFMASELEFFLFNNTYHEAFARPITGISRRPAITASIIT